MAKRRNPEAQIQKAVLDILKTAGIGNLFFCHVANAPRNRIAGANLKRLGAVAGTPDGRRWTRALS
jgi:hypothetical protein